MSFTSLNFLGFLLIVIVLNYCLPRRYRWILLLAASYFFYLNWQPAYAIILLLTTVSTYICARLLDRQTELHKYRKRVCVIGCMVPLLSLFFFKYYNFIASSIYDALGWMHLHIEMPQLDFLMPIGISFYTFTAIGYLIDIYRKQYAAEKNLGIFALFISFFAQIASGPIPRGGQLIPQLRNPERLSYDNVIGGLKTMLWGFFMKLCVANRIGIYVDVIYGNIDHHNGVSLFIAAILYTIQIYCDFAGYSFIAIGAARMLGIQLMENFRRPYFATSIKDFWSRWHISLSTWFRDYVYIPLGGNRVSKSRNISNLISTFLVSGLWHGAAYNYLIWGGLHGVSQSIERNVKPKNTKKGALKTFFKIVGIFFIINFLWVFFRLSSLKEIGQFFSKISSEFGSPFFHISLVYGAVAIIILFTKDLIDEYWPSLKLLNSSNFIISNVATGILIALILLLGVFDSTSFIYFQF